MRSRVDRRPPDRAPAVAWLTDWLETGPVPAEGLRRVLVVGEPASADVLADRLPGAHVVAGLGIPVGADFDLVAVVGAGAETAELRAAAAAIRVDGTLLVLTSGAAHPGGGLLPAGWDPAVAGLQLVAFDDLSDGSGRTAGRPCRWLRATYRRMSR